MDKRLETLEECEGLDQLYIAMHSLCVQFGSVARLDILPASHLGKQQALCFLRMGTPEQEEDIARELGIGRFGGDLILVVSLGERHVSGPASTASSTGSGFSADLSPQRPAQQRHHLS